MKKNKKYRVVFVIGVIIGALKMTESSTVREKITKENNWEEIRKKEVQEAEEIRKRENAHWERLRNKKYD